MEGGASSEEILRSLLRARMPIFKNLYCSSIDFVNSKVSALTGNSYHEIINLWLNGFQAPLSLTFGLYKIPP